MYIGKKKIRKINFITHIHDVIEELMDDSEWLDNAPDMWTDDEKIIFDMLEEIEYRVKQDVLKIINNKTILSNGLYNRCEKELVNNKFAQMEEECKIKRLE